MHTVYEPASYMHPLSSAGWPSPMEDYKYLFKVVLIGNAGVGKTCLVRRFTQVRIIPFTEGSNKI